VFTALIVSFTVTLKKCSSWRWISQQPVNTWSHAIAEIPREGYAS